MVRKVIKTFNYNSSGTLPHCAGQNQVKKVDLHEEPLHGNNGNQDILLKNPR